MSQQEQPTKYKRPPTNCRSRLTEALRALYTANERIMALEKERDMWMQSSKQKSRVIDGTY